MQVVRITLPIPTITPRFHWVATGQSGWPPTFDYLIKEHGISSVQGMCVFCTIIRPHTHTLSILPFCYHDILLFEKIKYSAKIKDYSDPHRKLEIHSGQNISSDNSYPFQKWVVFRLSIKVKNGQEKWSLRITWKDLNIFKCVNLD